MFGRSRGALASGDVFDRLDAYWFGGKTGFFPTRNAVATEEELLAFERVHSIKLQTDPRTYFLRFNGIEEGPDLFSFWPIDKLIPLERPDLNLIQGEGYFIFADYLIESHCYAIYLGDDPLLRNRVIIPDLPNIRIIAEDFSDFLELYIRDDPKLYGNT
jgi:hypothetical protein